MRGESVARGVTGLEQRLCDSSVEGLAAAPGCRRALQVLMLLARPLLTRIFCCV